MAFGRLIQSLSEQAEEQVGYASAVQCKRVYALQDEVVSQAEDGPRCS